GGGGGEVGGACGGAGEGREEGGGGAWVDRAVEQVRAEGREHVRARVLRARRLAAERDVAGVAAKGGNIALHPAERLLDVQDTIVAEGMALIVQRRMR